MKAKLISPHTVEFTCFDPVILDRVQDICDGEKVRNEPRTLFPALSLPKLNRIFPNKWQGVCEDDATRQRLIEVSESIRARRLAIEQIRQDYRAAGDMVFNYNVRGDYAPLRHQIAMARCVAETTKCGLLADPGTCKTSAYLWGLDMLREAGKVNRILIITLSHLKKNVLREMNVSVPHLRGAVIDGKADSDRIINKKFKLAKRNKDYEVYIANYECMSGVVEVVPEGFFDAVVVDEGHRIGSPTTNQTKAIVGMCENIPYKYVVTGTLVANNELSFFMPFRFMGPDTVPEADYFAFRSKHFYTVDPDQRIWKAEPSTRDLVRDQITKNAICFRKEDCLDLPGVVYETIEYQLRGDQADAYRKAKKELVFTMQKGCSECTYKFTDFGPGVEAMSEDGTPTACLQCPNTLLIKNALVCTGKLAQLCCGFFTETKTEYDANGSARNANVIHFMKENQKLDLVITELNNVPCDEKVIIWSNFTAGIKMLCERVGAAFGANSYIAVYGSVDAFAATDRFRNEPGLRFAIMNQAKAGTGLNLQFGHYQYYFMNDYSFVKRDQAIARQDRHGQKEKVLVTDFVGRCDGVKAIDWNILEILNSKKDLAARMTDLAKAIGLSASEWGIKAEAPKPEMTSENVSTGDPDNPPPWEE